MGTGLTVHTIDGYISTIYLVEYDSGLLLLDSGCRNDVKRIEVFVQEKLQRSLPDVKLAVATHMHPDHSGGAALLRKRYGIPIAAHQDADRWYAGIGGHLQHKLDCYMAHGVARRNHRHFERLLFHPRLVPNHPLQNGQPLPGFEDWQAICLAGHTLHDLALFNAEKGLLYIADYICQVKDTLQLPLPVLFPEQMARSYERLAALNASTLLLAHGDPIPGDTGQVLNTMKQKLSQPPNRIMKRVHYMSIYSPEARKLWRKKNQRKGDVGDADFR